MAADRESSSIRYSVGNVIQGIEISIPSGIENVYGINETETEDTTLPSLEYSSTDFAFSTLDSTSVIRTFAEPPASASVSSWNGYEELGTATVSLSQSVSAAQPTWVSHDLMPIKFTSNNKWIGHVETLPGDDPLGDWKHMHDGSGGTLAIIFDLTGSHFLQHLCGNSDISATRGFMIRIGSPNSTSQNITYEWYNGSTGTSVLANHTNGGWPQDEGLGKHCVIIRHTGLVGGAVSSIRMNAREITASTGIAPATGNPQWHMIFGNCRDSSVGAKTTPLNGGIGAILSFKRWISDEECETIEAWARENFETQVGGSMNLFPSE